MISTLNLRNFKCFADHQFDLKPLTILCGQNGAGKSSIIQSLLILQQASLQQLSSESTISLNGPFGMELGSVGDVLNFGSKNASIEFQVKSDGGTSRLKCRATDEDLENDYLKIETIEGDICKAFPPESAFHFTYLSAERLGPRDLQFIQSRPPEALVVGTKGEFAAEVLSKFERKEIRKAICHKDGDADQRLQQQVELWMGEWAKGVQIRADRFASTNAAAIRIKKRGVRSEWMRPPNFGFGISHSLPIVIGGLLAAEGGVFIVDTPESHLHPRAQSSVGEFLAKIAASGVQVIIETHSDHVLNGIRLAVKREHIQPENVAIYYFAPSETGEPIIDNPSLTKSGKLTKWPAGFFDQWQVAMHELL